MLDQNPAPGSTPEVERLAPARSDILRERHRYGYRNDTTFEDPLVIGGTNRVLQRSEEYFYPGGTLLPVAEVASAAKEYERSITVKEIEPGNLKIAHDDDSVKVDLNGTEYVLGLESGGSLQQLARIVGMKSTDHFVSHTPPELVARALDFYLGQFAATAKATEAEDDVPIRLEIVRTPERIERITKLGPKDIGSFWDRNPRTSEVLGEIEKTVERLVPEIEVSVRSHTKDPNFAKSTANYNLTLKHSDFDLDVEGEDYEQGIKVRISNRDPKNAVSILPMIYRQVCSNGMVATLTEDQQEKWMDTYARRVLQFEGINPPTDVPRDEWDVEARERYAQIHRQSKALVGGKGMSFSLEQLHLGFVKEFISHLLNYLRATPDMVATHLSELRSDFAEDVSSATFLAAAKGTAEELDLQRSQAFKDFVTQFTNDTVAREQNTGHRNIFTSPYEVLQWLTYTAQAYSEDEQQKVQAKAMLFAMALQGEVAKRHQYALAQQRAA